MPAFGSLFAGIGGIDLGLERAGWTCSWQVEIDDYCNRVLAKHWPNVRRWRDVRDFPPAPTADWQVDLIAGGFPCQPVSLAGRRKGTSDPRWLWPEFARVIAVLRPRLVLVENVLGLLGCGMGDILIDLAACGYDAEWDCISAAAVGAPHRRNRIWLVAYPASSGRNAQSLLGSFRSGTQDDNHAYQSGADGGTGDVADAHATRLAWSGMGRIGAPVERSSWWNVEPDVGRVAHGVPHRVDRLRCLGNAVVPHVVEWIGKRLLDA